MDAFSGPVIEQELRKICNKMQKLRLTPFEAMEFSKSMQNFLGNGKNTLSRRTNRVSELLISLLASLGIHQNCALGSFAARLLGRTRHEFEEGKCMANASVKVNFEAATEAMAKLTEDHCAATAEKQQIVKMKSFCVEQIQIDCYDWKTLSKEVAELVQKLTDFCHAKFFEMKVDEELEYYKNLLAFIKSGGFQEKLRRIQEKFPRVIKSSRFGVVGKERLKSEIDRFAHAIGQLLPKVGQIRTKVERTQSEWTKFEADRNKKIVETNQELGNISRIRAIGDEIHANRLHSQLEESRKSIKGVEKKQTAKREEIDKEMRPISAVDRQCWTVRGWLFEIGQECKKKIGNNEA